MDKQISKLEENVKSDYNILMSSLHVAVSKHLMDEDFTVVWANDCFYESTLYTRQEYEAIYHNNCRAYFQQDMVEYNKFAAAIQKAITARTPGYDCICRMPQKGGSYVWIKIVGTFTNQVMDGKPVIYSTFTDISDVMQMQIEQSVTYDNMPGFVAKYLVEEKNFLFLDANKNFLDFLGLTEEDLKNFTAFSTFTPESRRELEAHRAAMRRGEPVHFTARTRDRYGRDAWFQLNGACVDWIQGDPIYLIVYIDITDITEQRELQRQLEERTEQLKAALAAAEKANRAKSDFLARMSHDLRTPINAIVGMTAIAGAHLDEKERVLDSLRKISDSSKLLLSLINEVLDMSKIESGQFKLSEEEFCLGEVIQELVVMMQPDMQKKGHQFNVRVIGVQHEDVIGDSQRLQQILMNILSNAIKYTPEQGQILLEIRERDVQDGVAEYEFLFEDNGRGMKPEFLKKLFMPFERAEEQDFSGIQGTGLGMAISDRFARMMGGGIQVESEYGKGSRFHVRIPLRLQNPEQSAQDELSNYSVLIVDDDEIVRESMGECLESIGIKTSWAVTGEDSIELVREQHEQGADYFAVIMDFKLPGINGIEAARRIHKAVGDSVPILLLSAYNVELYETEAREAGITHFISKPLFKSKLVGTLKRLLHREEEPEAVNPIPLTNADYSGKRVLLVEDNELNREIAVEIIGSTRATVDEAVNGLEAVKILSDSPAGTYDMIFMDIQMPIMDGYEATRKIRRLDHRDARTIPIVAMTANAFSEDVQNALAAGMDAHLPKPIDIGQLMRVMGTYLAQKPERSPIGTEYGKKK